MDDPAAQIRNTKAVIIHDHCGMGIGIHGNNSKTICHIFGLRHHTDQKDLEWQYDNSSAGGAMPGMSGCTGEIPGGVEAGTSLVSNIVLRRSSRRIFSTGFITTAIARTLYFWCWFVYLFIALISSLIL